MADYIYLLENRLSAAQQSAIHVVRDLARSQELTVFLTGGAVRDLTSGSAVRDLDLTIVGEISLLRSGMEAKGAILTGENKASKALFFLFPGGVRVEVGSAVTVDYPKPGKPVYTPAGIIEDLRSRDFTANAMALSLNEGSYGLLMDPLNGVADIENRELRLISNYGFIEDPTRMVRAVRLGSRLGWQMEERTGQRYENAKAEDLFGTAAPFQTAYELEEIFYEEDAPRVMRALDAEGWMIKLSPNLAAAKPNEGALADLREKQGQLLTQGILVDASALALPFLLGKTAAADVAALKKSFARQGFAKQVDSLEERTRELQARFAGKEAATPSAAWRMLHEAEPELVLSMLVSGKGAVQARLKTFLQDSPTARQRIPYATLQEMRITPDLPIYNELLDKLFFELMDGKLSTPEEMKAYLEPYSPPAPPPPVNLRRARTKKEARPSRAKAKKAAPETVAGQEEAIGVAEGLMEPGTLTGPDRGAEPTVTTPLEGKVAPLASGEADAAPKKAAKPRTAPIVSSDTDSTSARKLPAKPTSMAKADVVPATPHPIAAKAPSKRPVVIPAASRKSASTKAAGKQAPAKKTQQKAVPAKKTIAAKAVKRRVEAAVKQSAINKKKVSSPPVKGKKAAPAPVKKKAVKLSRTSASTAKKKPARTVTVPTKKVAAKSPINKSSAAIYGKKSPAKKASAKKVAAKKVGRAAKRR